MEIRELEESEIKKIVDFYGNIVPPTDQMEDEDKKFESAITNAFGDDHMLVALENDKIIGFLRSQIRKREDGRKVDRVIMLLISVDRLGEGIGGQLIEREREYAREMDVDVLDIETG